MKAAKELTGSEDIMQPVSDATQIAPVNDMGRYSSQCSRHHL